MTTPHEPRQSRPSTASTASGSDTPTPSPTATRGASHAGEPFTRAAFNAVTSKAADTTPHAGTQTTQSHNVSAATYSTKEHSTYSAATSTPSAPVWPKPYALELAATSSSSSTTYSHESSSSRVRTASYYRTTKANTARDPWSVSPKVHDWMERHIPRSAKVLEIGGGAGTPALHEMFPNAITVEHDERWTRLLRQLDLHIIHAPLERGWYTLSHDLEAALQTADAVLIDGPPGGLRRNGARHLALIKPGAWVLYDDSQRADVRAGIAHPVVTTITDQHRSTTITRSDERA